MIGMAHRGRLSVLAHVLENHIVTCLLSSNMQNRRRSSKLWLTGDVKYHLGREQVVSNEEVSTRVILATTQVTLSS